MPQIARDAFERLPLRVHTFLAGVPLHDVWAIDLPPARATSGANVHVCEASIPKNQIKRVGPLKRVREVRIKSKITLAEFLRRAGPLFRRPPPAIQALLSLRFFIGSLFGWDQPATDSGSESFAQRLTDADRARSLAPPGTPDGLFRVVYRFENEQLVEIVNRTAHAAALSALVETATRYRFYFAVYVREVSPLTPLYMAAIDPFRKLIVYPSLLRSIAAQWNKTFRQDKHPSA